MMPMFCLFTAMFIVMDPVLDVGYRSITSMRRDGQSGQVVWDCQHHVSDPLPAA